MERHTAATILRALADGRDPYTGSRLADGAHHHPDTVRALYCAIAALEASPAVSTSPPPADAPAAAAPRSRRPAPANTGKPWSREEDERLLAAFDAGEAVTALAAAHARSRVAIEARLARFGRMPMPGGLRSPAGAPPTPPLEPVSPR